jgi:hypothetical protein
MNTTLTIFANREDATSGCAHRLHLITTPNACLIARIGWCRRQAMKALTTPEVEEWCAEKRGLIDALLHRDCRYE